MALFLTRAVNDATNIAKLTNTLNSKIDSIKEETNRGFETPSYVFLGSEYDEMLRAIKGEDILTAQKWLLAVSFVIKSEEMRLEKGENISEDASAFFEGLISTLLDTLGAIEGKPSLIAGNMWFTLCEAIGMILKPNVATSVKCHKRMANRTFNFLLQIANNEHTEQLLLIVLAWMCSSRSFDVNREEDAVYINQLRRLQKSANDHTSKEATKLILINLQKVVKRDAKVLSDFIMEHVKLVTKELELGTNDKVDRALQMIDAIFNACKRCDSEIVLDLVPMWNMFEAIFHHLQELSVNTIKQAFVLLSRVAKWLGPDYILVNIQRIQKVFINIFNNPTELLMQYAIDIELSLRDMGEICTDFYLAMAPQLTKLIEQVNKEIDAMQFHNVHKLIGIIAQLDGSAVGHFVEALIFKLAALDKSHWSNTDLANSIVRLINKHLSVGCSMHAKALKIMLVFTQQLRDSIGHDRFADRTILLINEMLSSANESNVSTDYTLYTQELQNYLEAMGQKNAYQQHMDGSSHKESNDTRDNFRTKRDDVVDAIKKRLKSMRQPFKVDCSEGPYITQ
ncbi:hypothetical protein BaOVIS_021080 [Babesia ovis]|uniref:Uncharacterized protein n=1 Tax=Babesia ovis TaxID=5869 RepID=A0A9W5WVB7_BABOV|nr:hypothetical protein BaOVIS_021080 [Babesia ovis]